MRVAHLPKFAKYIGRDLFDTCLYYETPRFLYTFMFRSGEIIRSYKSVKDNLDLK